MAKKFTRVLSIIVSAILLISMLSCMAYAETPLNTAAEIENVVSPEASEIRKFGLDWKITVPAKTAKMTFSLEISEGASVVVTDPLYNMPLTEKNGAYAIDPVLAGDNAYVATVVSEDGATEKSFDIVISREKLTDCALLGIEGAEQIGSMYVAFTPYEEFHVSATVSEGASYRLYTEAECINELPGLNVALSQPTTVVWLKVFAEDDKISSGPVKLLINTYDDTEDTEEKPVTLPMENDGIIGVAGGYIDPQGGIIVVPLDPETELYSFKAVTYDNYVLRLFSDRTANHMRPEREMVMKLDAGRTILYATATKGTGANKVVKEYTIYILAPRVYSYTDEQAEWAKEYVEYVGNNGWGMMKGDLQTRFNGEKLLSRYEMAALMVRISGANVHLYEEAHNPFHDEIAPWALNYVKAAYRMGMINGFEEVKDGKDVVEFRGDENATRAQFFRVFTNAILAQDVDDYYAIYKRSIDAAVAATGLKDLEEIPDWAKPAVYTAIYMRLVIGNNEKKVNAETEITRNEVAAVLSRYYDILESRPDWRPY